MELQVRDEFSVQLAEMEKIQEICDKLMKSRHYQTLGEAGIHAIMARAKTLGIHPFEALNGGFTCIHGKVGMSTEMMCALVRRNGHSVSKDPKSNSEICILHGKRKDTGDEWTCSFSKNDAIAAGLWNGPTWKKYPAIMLYNRCMSMLFRQLFADLSLGAGYGEDELKEITKTGDYAKKNETIDCEVEDLPSTVDPEPSKTTDPLTEQQIEELRLLWEDCHPDIRKNISSILKTSNIPRISEIPATSFDYFKNLMLNNSNTDLTKDLKSE